MKRLVVFIAIVAFLIVSAFSNVKDEKKSFDGVFKGFSKNYKIKFQLTDGKIMLMDNYDTKIDSKTFDKKNIGAKFNIVWEFAELTKYDQDGNVVGKMKVKMIRKIKKK